MKQQKLSYILVPLLLISFLWLVTPIKPHFPFEFVLNLVLIIVNPLIFFMISYIFYMNGNPRYSYYLLLISIMIIILAPSITAFYRIDARAAFYIFITGTILSWQFWGYFLILCFAQFIARILSRNRNKER